MADSSLVNGFSHSKNPLELLKDVNTFIETSGVLWPDRNSPVVQFLHPHELKKKIDLSIGEEGSDDPTIKSLCQQIIDHSVKTCHPHFHNQLFGATDPYGLIGAVMTDALNTSQYTYEVGPAVTIIETNILARVLQLFNIPNGDGIMAPGGSMSNMYGLMLARHRLVPEAKQKGVASVTPLVVFTSADAHYSMVKGVNWLGIGTDNLVKIPCDELGQMIPDQLEKLIQETVEAGKLPMCVNVTAGTTVLGAFDPIQQIADICKKYQVWMHVDACWGGSLIFSKKHRHLLSGIERADSIAWNPHKMLGAPLQCSIFITSHKGLLHECNCASATYLFQQDKFYDVSYDTGDKSVQCGRKVDSLKLWVMWRARGESGFEKLVDSAMENARYLAQKLSSREGFRLVAPGQCTNVCFWYIPKRLRGQTETEEWWSQIDAVAPKIKEAHTMSGSLMIGYQPLKHRGLRNFFRMVVTCHPARTHADMDFVIEQIDKAGVNL